MLQCYCVSRIDNLESFFLFSVGLFGEGKEEEEKEAFENAINDVNRDSNLLKKTLLQPHIEMIDLRNAYTIKDKRKYFVSESLG